MPETLGKNINENHLIPFAQIGRPHGLQGAFFLKTKDNTQVWHGYKYVYIENENGSFEKIKVTKHYVSGKYLVIKLANIHTKEHADQYYLRDLFIERKQINLNESEILVHDLIGFKIISNQKEIGIVLYVHSFGAQENLEIKLNDSEETVFYPYLKEYIIETNSENKTILVEYIPEFLESNKSL